MQLQRSGPAPESRSWAAPLPAWEVRAVAVCMDRLGDSLLKAPVVPVAEGDSVPDTAGPSHWTFSALALRDTNILDSVPFFVPQSPHLKME